METKLIHIARAVVFSPQIMILHKPFDDMVKCIPQGPFFAISALIGCIKFDVFLIRFIYNLIINHQINWFYEMLDLFVSDFFAFMRLLDFGMLLEYYISM